MRAGSLCRVCCWETEWSPGPSGSTPAPSLVSPEPGGSSFLRSQLRFPRAGREQAPGSGPYLCQLCVPSTVLLLSSPLNRRGTGTPRAGTAGEQQG